MQAPSSRSALAFILVTVTLDVLALGLMIPILPKLVEGMLGGDTPEAARVYGWFGTAFAVLQFVFMPVLGGCRTASAGAP
jgi:DHA1 family tetracycline resistance protein-like MFS transporter